LDQLRLVTLSKETQSILDRAKGETVILMKFTDRHQTVGLSKPVILDSLPQLSNSWKKSFNKRTNLSFNIWENLPSVQTRENLENHKLVSKFENLLSKSCPEVQKDLELLIDHYREGRSTEIIPKWLLFKYKHMLKPVSSMERFCFPFKFQNSLKLTSEEYNNPQLLNRYKYLLKRSELLIQTARFLKSEESITIIPTGNIYFRRFKNGGLSIPKGSILWKLNFHLLNFSRCLIPLNLPISSNYRFLLKEESYKRIENSLKTTLDITKSFKDFLLEGDFTDINNCFNNPDLWKFTLPSDLKQEPILYQEIKDDKEEEEDVVYSYDPIKDQLKFLENKVQEEISAVQNSLYIGNFIKYGFNTRQKDIESGELDQIFSDLINSWHFKDPGPIIALRRLIEESPHYMRRAITNHYMIQIDNWIYRKMAYYLKGLLSLSNTIKRY